MAVDDTLEVPEGWDVEAFGPWVYNRRYPQVYTQPRQAPPPSQSPSATQSRLQLPSPISKADQLRAIIREGRIPPQSNVGGAFHTADPATHLRESFPALEAACKDDPSLANEALRLINEHLPALQNAFKVDPGLDRTTETDTLSVDDCKSESVHKVDESQEVAETDSEAYRSEASGSASAPSSQVISERVFTPPSSAPRRGWSEVDDGDEAELCSKKARVLDPDRLMCEYHRFEGRDNWDCLSCDRANFGSDIPANDVGRMEDDSNSISPTEIDADNGSSHTMTMWHPGRYSETKRYTRCNQGRCRRDLVTLVAGSDGVDVDISGVEPAPVTNATDPGTVPPPFSGKSLTMGASSRRQVTGAIDNLF